MTRLSAIHLWPRRALEGHYRSMVEDRDLLGFDFEADQTARRLVGWLRSGKVQVRRYGKGFLHGKAYLVATGSEGVIAGSSNFTQAGLSQNEELNLGQYQPSIVTEVAQKIDELGLGPAPPAKPYLRSRPTIFIWFAGRRLPSPHGTSEISASRALCEQPESRIVCRQVNAISS